MGKKRNLGGIARFTQLLESAGAGEQEKSEEKPEAGPSSPRRNDSPQITEQPRSKKRKLTGLLGEGHEKYDATNLVERYIKLSSVPEHLQKYFSQRKRYFSLYDDGCLLDEEGWYSVTPEKIADQIAERCRCDVVLDAFCGVGGNAIAFAKTCHRVIALDNSPVRLALARHNAIIYGVEDRIEFILADYLDFARSYSKRPHPTRDIDVVFLSPPWGGPSYLTGSPSKDSTGSDDIAAKFSLKNVLPIPGDELFHLSREITPNIAYFLPRNIDVWEISRLVKQEGLSSTQRSAEEKVEIEQEFMSGKLKAVTCYFGGLVPGQEDMF